MIEEADRIVGSERLIGFAVQSWDERKKDVMKWERKSWDESQRYEREKNIKYTRYNNGSYVHGYPNNGG